MSFSRKKFPQWMGLILGSLTFTASWAIYSQAASAQAAYGSYIGVGPTFGLGEDDNGDGLQVGGVISVRYKLLELPISFRVQSLIGSGTAIIPTISYDLPLNWQTDVYLGAGVSFASGEDPSPVGAQTSFALQPGIDYALPNSDTMLFGNAIFTFDAYEDGGGAGFAIQGGMGVQF